MNKILILLITLTSVLIGSETLAQSSYLPKNLGDSVNSSYSEINPVVTSDGRTMFFTRVNHPKNTFGPHDSEDIWVSELKEDKSWSKAKHLPDHINIARYNSVLSISADGKTMLLHGVFNKRGNIWKERGLSVSTMQEDNIWGTPEKLSVKKYDKFNRGLNSNASMSADGKVLVLSFSKIYNGKSSDLFVSTKKDNGKWKKPKKLKKLSTSASEEAPFLSSDNKTLYFSSNRKKGKGSHDIYYAERVGTSYKLWSNPKRMNDTINSSGWESYFKTGNNESMAYYTSTKDAMAKADIFTIKLFEPRPYVVVSGKVLNKLKNMPLSARVDYRILSNGQVPDSLIIDRAQGSFKLYLPFGRKYILSAPAENYTAESVTVDASDLNEYTEITQNLYIEPLSYVLIKGKIYLKHTNQLVPPSSHPKIVVDGVVMDSIKINSRTGEYEVKLAHGQSYNISVKADRYTSIQQVIDVKSIDEYKELEKDLYVDVPKVAILTGKIFDKKTEKPFPSGFPLRIEINDGDIAEAEIDSLSNTYEIELPLGESYTISAKAENYYPVFEIIDLSMENEKMKVYKDLYLVPIEVGQSIRLNNIFFETGKSTLKTESFPELDRVAKFLTDNPTIKIEIAGHTDNVGMASTNMELSLERAEAVTDYIILKGTAAENISSKGYGFTKPLAENESSEGRSMNRRVEFTILDK